MLSTYEQKRAYERRKAALSAIIRYEKALDLALKIIADFRIAPSGHPLVLASILFPHLK